ncbi:MAG TPA: glycosyl hydrolase family 65 protein [Micromonosporaceae bacterium]
MVTRQDAERATRHRRHECVVFDWSTERAAEAAEVRGLITMLCDHGMDVAVASDAAADSVDAALQARPAGPGNLFLCAGSAVYRADPAGLRLLRQTEHPVPWLLGELSAHGLPAEAVLTIDRADPEPVAAILAEQLRRRADVPVPLPAPEWRVEADARDRRLTRVHESLLTIADGRLGTRGSPVAGDGTTAAEVVMAGVYEGDGEASQLAPLPLWGTLSHAEPKVLVWQTLDLRSGLLVDHGPVAAVRFSSLARPATVVLRASGSPDVLPGSGRQLLPGPATAALADRRDGPVLDRIGSYHTDPAIAAAALADAEEAGFDRLLREHRQAWARRWRHADVVIDGDRHLQQAVRFALFHIMASVGDDDEAAVGARGLSGPAYLGHVFWDSDVFVLPFLAATHPSAARAMLEYRIRRLPAARAAARSLGLDGARFPWESAVAGVDVTPGSVKLPTGDEAVIRTGDLEEHIVADVAWAAACYLDWTGDVAFAAGPGGELLADTARYWASRVRLDEQGRGHIEHVMGPDEYHQPVDDNAYTNVMARWNLRRAAEVPGVAQPERDHWLALADTIVDGYHPQTGRYEQFAGFFDLEPLIIAEPGVAPRRPIAAELLFGVARTARSQVVKQADVLMLHHLVPDETVPGSLEPNLDYYEPRTAHGSSLSPAVHASILARAGRFDDALHWLTVAARMDLDDLSGSTAGGLHLATMGGLWQALAFGFAGLQVRGDRLVVRPSLPPDWRALELNLRFRGAPVRLHLSPAGQVRVDSDSARVQPVGDHWEVVTR